MTTRNTLDTSYTGLRGFTNQGRQAAGEAARITFTVIAAALSDFDDLAEAVKAYKAQRRTESVTYLQTIGKRKYGKAAFTSEGTKALRTLRKTDDNVDEVMYLIDAVGHHCGAMLDAEKYDIDIADVLSGKLGAYGRLTSAVTSAKLGSNDPKSELQKLTDLLIVIVKKTSRAKLATLFTRALSAALSKAGKDADKTFASETVGVVKLDRK